MAQKIGPKEAGNRAQREAQYAERRAKVKPVAEIKSAIAAIPVKRRPKPKRGARP